MLSIDEGAEFDGLFNYQNAVALFESARRTGAVHRLDWVRGKENESVEYALLGDWTDADAVHDLPPDSARFAELAKKCGMTGFHVDDIYFIVDDNVPEDFRKHVLFHEIKESRLHGVGEAGIMDVASHMNSEDAAKYIEDGMDFALRYPHIKGCEVEIASIFYRGEEFARRYAQWLLETNGEPDDPTTFFNQAIPGFLSRNGRLERPPLDVLVEFLVALGHDNYAMGTDGGRERYGKPWPWIVPYLPEKPIKDSFL